VLVDGLLYPHGIALILMPVISFASATGQSLGFTMVRALDLRRGRALPVTLPDGAETQFKLDALAGQLLTYLGQQVLGAAAGAISPGEPLTVATIVRGRDGDPQRAPVAGGDIHRVLEGLCTWHDQWQSVEPLTDLESANLLLGRQRSRSDYVHHQKRGRAVWMPSHFSELGNTAKHKYKLGCYHRNLTLLMLQTEMLAQAVALFMNFPQKHQRQKYNDYYELAHHAAIRLGILYGNLKDRRKPTHKQTYNSASPRLYLEENGYVKLVNEARRHFKLPGDLAYQPW
jgi:hypothetical protein